MEKKENKVFRTSDLQLATFLLTKGLTLFDVDKSTPRQAVFVFEDTENRIALVAAFWNSSTLVNHQKFVQAQKTLKHRLYSDAC